jgi:3-oxoadipate enol-lactonase
VNRLAGQAAEQHVIVQVLSGAKTTSRPHIPPGTIDGMEKMIGVEGGTVWAEDTGGPGAPVVLLHPGIGDSRIWDPIVPRLSARYRVIRYDARGHGASPPATVPYRLLDDLIIVLDHLDVPQATFAGCSQGGATSIDLALAQPERVSALVLISPGLSGYPWPDEPELDAEFDALAAAGDIEGSAAAGLRVWAAAGHDDTAVAQLRSAAKAWIANGDREQDGAPAFDRLGEIKAPTIVMVGDKDHPPLIECDELIAARVPGCRKIDVPGGDHLLPLRVPDLVAETIGQLAG